MKREEISSKVYKRLSLRCNKIESERCLYARKERR
jgi:hypothetical protein